MKKIIGAIVLATSATAVADVQLKNGNEISLIPVSGFARVMCYDPQHHGMHSAFCDATYASPGAYDSVVNLGEAIQADQISVSATHADKSMKSKNVKFNATKQESKSINLLIRSLTQSPLLERGINKLDYTFSRDGQAMRTGSFEVNVKTVEEQSCESLSFTAHSACHTHADICNRYWNSNPVCN